VRAGNGGTSNLTLRIATAAIGIPIVLVINMMGGVAFTILIGLAAAVAALEFCQMMRHAGHRPSFLTAVPASAATAALPMLVRRPERAWVGLIVLVLAAGGAYFLAPHAYRSGLLGWATTLVALLYAGVMLGHLSLLREIPRGAWWIAITLIVTWAYDTGAYATGRAAGRRPFMTHISPNKTWEGVFGGLALSSLAGFLAVPAVGLRPWEAPALGFVLGAVAQLGDLVESMIKRQVGVKDSGALFPGHGGLLDRIDSLLFSGATAYYAAVLLGYAA
jgi:phosphatidate cytidylyltransferase